MKAFFCKLISYIENSHQARVEHYIRMMHPTNPAEVEYHLQEYMRKSVSQR